MKRCSGLSLSAKGNPKNIRVIVKSPGKRKNVSICHRSVVVHASPDAVQTHKHTSHTFSHTHTHTTAKRESKRERAVEDEGFLSKNMSTGTERQKKKVCQRESEIDATAAISLPI